MRDAGQEEVLERRHRRIGEFLDALGSGAGVRDLEGGKLLAVRMRFPTEEEPSMLLVVTADAADGPQIAFVGAYNPGDALLAWRARQAGKGMKWRENVPWGERG